MSFASISNIGRKTRVNCELSNNAQGRSIAKFTLTAYSPPSCGFYGPQSISGRSGNVDAIGAELLEVNLCCYSIYSWEKKVYPSKTGWSS